MIRISDKSMCCGCTACATACPAQCRVMRRDREGFDYPVANPDLCVGCGKCEKVCPMLNPSAASASVEVLAARSEEHVAGSSSGGVFPALAKSVIEDGGVVFGAVIESDHKVAHAEASELSEIEAMRGSKYAQSDLYSAFEDVKQYLTDGTKVLFTGTPCQIAGLKNYLGSNTEGLMTIDFACHGVPSPGLWEKYVKALEARSGGRIRSLSFRDKSRSWRHYCFRHDDVSVEYVDDPYMALFVQDMSLRPSCYKCPFRAGRKASDLTLADLWSVAEAAPAFNDDKGASAVFVNTAMGKDLVHSVSMQSVAVSAEAAMRDNGGYSDPDAIPERREEFFKGVHGASDLIAYMKGFVVRRPLHQRIYRKVRRLLSDMKKRIVR